MKKLLIIAAIGGVIWYFWKRNQTPRSIPYTQFIREMNGEPVGDFSTTFWRDMFNGTNTPGNVMDGMIRGPIDILNPTDRMALA